MKKCMLLKDYEVQTNLIRSIGYFLVSQDGEIRKKVTRAGFLQELLNQHDCSSFFRIKRICKEFLNEILSIDQSMFELNELI